MNTDSYRLYIFSCNIQQSIEYPAFTGSAYLAIKTPVIEKSLHMSMKIKAMSPVTDGIIMYCAESDIGHGGFTALIVREGRLEFRYQQGDGKLLNKDQLNSLLVSKIFALDLDIWEWKINEKHSI